MPPTSKPTSEHVSPSAQKKELWKPLLLILGVLAMFTISQAFGLGEYLKAVQPWIQSQGALAPLAFVAVYIAASVAALPGSILSFAAGALFGAFWGVIWVSVASTASAGICFLIARYLARAAIEKNLKSNPQFQKLDRMSARQGAFIVAIVRLLPIFPFNLLNYGFGLTRVPFWTYLFWSWICMLPGTVLYVTGADALKQTLAQGKIPWTLVGVIGIAIIVLSIVGALARKHLKSSQS